MNSDSLIDYYALGFLRVVCAAPVTMLLVVTSPWVLANPALTHLQVSV